MTLYAITTNHETHLNLTAFQAADMIMSDDSQEWDIRHDGEEWVVWTRKECANRPWSAHPMLSSLADTLEGAQAELATMIRIRHQVGEGSPWVQTMESYERDQAEMAQE